MSTMALNLPMNYVDIDRDEMEYIDGGVVVSNRWYGTNLFFSKSECNDIAAVLTVGAGAGAVGTGIAAVIPGVNAAAVPIMTIGSGLLAMGSGIFWLAGNHNGLNVTVFFTGATTASINW